MVARPFVTTNLWWTFMPFPPDHPTAKGWGAFFAR
jgi:hypothetical protein